MGKYIFTIKQIKQLTICREQTAGLPEECELKTYSILEDKK